MSALAGELTGRGHNALAVVSDVSRYDHVERLADEAFARFGGVHVLVQPRAWSRAGAPRT